MRIDNSVRDESLRMSALVLFSAFIWCAVMNRWTIDFWQTPAEYVSNPSQADILYHLAQFKAGMEGHFPPFLLLKKTEILF